MNDLNGLQLGNLLLPPLCALLSFIVDWTRYNFQLVYLEYKRLMTIQLKIATNWIELKVLLIETKKIKQKLNKNYVNWLYYNDQCSIRNMNSKIDLSSIYNSTNIM